VAKVSEQNTGGGEGIIVEKNEPFYNKPDLFQNYREGQYTLKTYKLERFKNHFDEFLILKGFNRC
jgi:hypothetical protein